VQAGPPQAVPPEEAHLKEQISKAVEAMADSGQSLGTLECRFKSRVSVRLSEAGPGPAAGGPMYFRVDAWSVSSGFFGAPPSPVLYARAFVPINDAKYHRRSCTWPMIDAAGKDVAYLTCEFSFARIPSPVQELTATAAGNEVNLTWLASNEDRVVPTKGYRVDSRCLGRGKRAGNSTWQHEGDVDAHNTRFGIQGLKPDTIYLLRVCAVNEVGLSEAEEVEVKTGPCAPAGCGQPRLAGCNGPVLAVEWDPPMYDGGANLVAYRVWVRPFSATDADPSDWLEVGHVKHSSGVQRAEIHTEDLDPSIGRYLCRVAAINAAGEVGPATPDAVSLTLPNPCAVSRPTPQAPLALGDREGHFSGMWPQSGANGNLLTMTINEPGKRKVTVPLFQDGLSDDLPLGLFNGQYGAQSSMASASDGISHDLALPEHLDAHQGAWSMPPDLDSRHWYHEDAFPGYEEPMEQALVPFKATPPRARGHLDKQQDLLRRLLEEKRSLLESSLQTFHQLSEELQITDSEALRIRHEEAEIEAAGYQAEVAVLSQKLNELDAQSLYSADAAGASMMHGLNSPFPGS